MKKKNTKMHECYSSKNLIIKPWGEIEGLKVISIIAIFLFLWCHMLRFIGKFLNFL